MFSLMTKLLVAGLFISVIPLLISQYIGFIQTSKKLKSTYAEGLKHKAELTTLLINQSISHRFSELNIISSAINEWLKEKKYEVISEKFLDLKSSKYDIKSISLLDENGSVVLSTQNSEGIKKTYPQLKKTLNDYKKYKYTENIFVSELIFSSEDSYVYLIQKVKNSNHIVALAINMSNIELLLLDFDDEVVGDKPVYILDKNYNIVMTSGEKSVVNTIYKDKKHISKESKDGIYFFKDYKGENVVATYESLYQFGSNKDLGWVVFASIPVELINKSVNDTLKVNKQVGFFIVLATFIFLILISRSFAKPIRRIVEVANKISNGDYSARIVEKNNTSEFNTLISVINEMVEKIQTRTDKLEEQKLLLNNLAHYDTLTDVPNRLLFKDRLEQAMIKADRNKKQFALFYIDLDEFKHINDSYGHDYGDEVLKVVVSRISGVIRKEDTLARIGGDEFTIILEELQDANSATLVADKVVSVIKDPIELGENTFKISTSIGISVYPKDSKDKTDLIKFADIAMYKAKATGKDNYQFYSDDMRNHSLKRVKMKHDIDKALESDQFEVYYQAQVNAKTGEYTGMEALVRWRNYEYGLIQPAKFLPLAEELGMVIEIDRWVMRKVMGDIVSWRQNGYDVQKVSINLSIKHLQHDSFIPTLKQYLDQTGCNGKWLEFEVTETHIISNYDESINKLKEMHALGIKISIDDFGTGYSSLSYLKYLPIDKLKIDKSFIDDLLHDQEDISIVKSIIWLCKCLNLSVIAEGVETKEQSDFLVEIGCDLQQGYLFAKPQSKEDFEKEFLKN